MSVIWRAPLWAWLVTLPLLALLCGLGTWQVTRGLQKKALAASYADAAARQPADLGASIPEAGEHPIRARASGRYDSARQLLLDNQSHDGRPGYHLWTPLRLADGILLVDRGWLPLGEHRLIALTAPAGEIAVTGLWRRLPEPGLRLDDAAACTPSARFPALVNYPTQAQLSCLLGEPVAGGLLLLDAAAAGGFVRDWDRQLVSIPPTRHYGYAVQWYALAATLLFLFIRFNLRRKPS